MNTLYKCVFWFVLSPLKGSALVSVSISLISCSHSSVKNVVSLPKIEEILPPHDFVIFTDL